MDSHRQNGGQQQQYQQTRAPPSCSAASIRADPAGDCPNDKLRGVRGAEPPASAVFLRRIPRCRNTSADVSARGSRSFTDLGVELAMIPLFLGLSALNLICLCTSAALGYASMSNASHGGTHF